MGQLTLSRFRGDTSFGFLTRIGSTFVGGIIGAVVWLVSTLLPAYCVPDDCAIGTYRQVLAMEMRLVWLLCVLFVSHSFSSPSFIGPFL